MSVQLRAGRSALCGHAIARDAASAFERRVGEWNGLQDLSGTGQIAFPHQDSPAR